MILGMETVERVIRERRAIRRYQDKPVPLSLIDKLLELATWAPSAHNRQPWRFGVLTQLADKQRLANGMGQKLRQDRERDGDAPEVIEKDVARSYARITQAPVVIIICLSMADMDRYPDFHRANAERTMAVQSVAMAAQNILLAAHSSGLGGCWLCAPLFVPQLVQKLCRLPSDWEPQGLITVGYPAQAKTKMRADWHTKVKFL